MMDLDGWSVAIALAAVYVAIVSLVGLMRRRRDALIEDLLQQVEIERLRRKARQREQERDRLRKEVRQKNAA